MGNFRPGYLNQGDPLGQTSTTILLSADNQVVFPAGLSLINLHSDSTTAANRTFTLGSPSVAGQQLMLILQSGSSTTCQLSDSGNVKLTNPWEPTQYDSISLSHDGTYWVETGRSLQTGSVFLSGLADANLLIYDSADARFENKALSGDVTITAAGVASIASGVIVDADVNASAAIAYSKLAPLTSANILVGSAGNVATVTPMSGDVTIDNTGVTTLTAGVVTISTLVAAVIREVSGTLSQADLLSLTSPIVLVPAGAAGTVHVVDEIELLHSYSTAPYALGADVNIEYEISGEVIVLIASTFFTASASSNNVIKPTCYDLDSTTGTGAGLDVTLAEGKGVQISSASFFTGGDVDNIVKYRIRYHTVTLLT